MWKTIDKEIIVICYWLKTSTFMIENGNESGNPVLTFEGKKYLINELSKDIKESIKGLQIAETQLKMHEDTLKLLSISRNFLASQLREKLKNIE